MDRTDAVVLQVQAREVSEFPEGAGGDVSDVVFVELQGLQAGREAAGETGQQIVAEAELLQTREGQELVVHVTEPVSGHRESRGPERDGAGERAEAERFTQNQRTGTEAAAASGTGRHEGDQRTEPEKQ